jgi:hypothetical protein
MAATHEPYKLAKVCKGWGRWRSTNVATGPEARMR